MTLADDDAVQCDMCKNYGALWTRFCTVCGFDFCSDCELTHNAVHEFSKEAQNIE